MEGVLDEQPQWDWDKYYDEMSRCPDCGGEPVFCCDSLLKCGQCGKPDLDHHPVLSNLSLSRAKLEADFKALSVIDKFCIFRSIWERFDMANAVKRRRNAAVKAKSRAEAATGSIREKRLSEAERARLMADALEMDSQVFKTSFSALALPTGKPEDREDDRWEFYYGPSWKYLRDQLVVPAYRKLEGGAAHHIEYRFPKPPEDALGQVHRRITDCAFPKFWIHELRADLEAMVDDLFRFDGRGWRGPLKGLQKALVWLEGWAGHPTLSAHWDIDRSTSALRSVRERLEEAAGVASVFPIVRDRLKSVIRYVDSEHLAAWFSFGLHSFFKSRFFRKASPIYEIVGELQMELLADPLTKAERPELEIAGVGHESRIKQQISRIRSGHYASRYDFDAAMKRYRERL